MGRQLGVSEDYLATGRERDEDKSVLIEAEIALRLDERETAAEGYTRALESAETRDERARALEGLGELAYREGKPREAIARLEEAQVLWGGDLLDHPSAAETLGRAYAALDEYEAATSIFRRSLDAAEARNDLMETVRFAVLLANAHIDRGNFSEAEALLEKSVSAAPDAKDPIFRARLYWSQSRLHTMQQDHGRAARYARKALDLLELTEHTYYTAQAHQLLAHIELDRERPEEALSLLERGLSLLGQSGNQLDRALFKLEEARALIQLERPSEAASLAMEAVGILSDAHPEDAGRGYALIAEVYEQLGDAQRALELYELASDKLSRASGRYLVDVYQKRARLLEAEGRKDEALEVLKRAVTVQASS
jgi:tetratricopeptide (TPR) repeat protein